MEQKEILEGNMLIAEFMGYIDNGCSEDGFLINPITNYDEDISELKYEVSWERLMPVVGKIDELGAKVTITRMKCDIEYKDPLNADNGTEISIACGIKITAVYSAAIQFINWYNLNKLD